MFWGFGVVVVRGWCVSGRDGLWWCGAERKLGVSLGDVAINQDFGFSLEK